MKLWQRTDFSNVNSSSKSLGWRLRRDLCDCSRVMSRLFDAQAGGGHLGDNVVWGWADCDVVNETVEQDHGHGAFRALTELTAASLSMIIEQRLKRGQVIMSEAANQLCP